MAKITEGLCAIVFVASILGAGVLFNKVEESRINEMNKQEQIGYYQKHTDSLKKMLPLPKGVFAYMQAAEINYCKRRISELQQHNNGPSIYQLSK